MNQKRGKTWLITGGCGYIGAALTQAIVQSSCDKIIIVDDFSVGQVEDLSNSIQAKIVSAHSINREVANFDTDRCLVLEGSVLDLSTIDSLVSHADIVVHLAANTGVGPSIENPASDFRSNVEGTFNVLESVRKHSPSCRVIFASSGAPLGEVATPPIHEELPAHPVSPYGASKLAGEGYCSAYFHSFGIETVCLRFGNVYGPGSIRKNSVVAKFIKRALLGKTLEVNGDGSQTRDFIFIDDLVDAIIKAGNSEDVGGEIFQIATNRESTVADILSEITDTLKSRGITQLDVKNKESLVGDVQRNFSDISKAKAMLSWSPKHDLKDGIDRTIEYFMDRRGQIKLEDNQ